MRREREEISKKLNEVERWYDMEQGFGWPIVNPQLEALSDSLFERLVQTYAPEKRDRVRFGGCSIY